MRPRGSRRRPREIITSVSVALLGIQRAVADLDAPVRDQRPGALEPTSSAVRRSTTTAHAELVHQPRDVRGGQALQVVGAQQHARARHAAAGERHAADVADVDRALEVNPGAQARPTAAATSGISTPPSSVWWFSISAISVRPTATAVPFSVCTCAGLPPSGR